MISRVGSFICISLGIAAIVVPMTAGRIGIYLGSRIALQPPQLDKSLVETITVEPYQINETTAQVGTYDEDCFWSKIHEQPAYKTSDLKSMSAL